MTDDPHAPSFRDDEPDPPYVDPSPDEAPAPDVPQDDRDVKNDEVPE